MLFSNLLNRLLQQLPKNKAVKLGIETFSGVSVMYSGDVFIVMCKFFRFALLQFLPCYSKSECENVIKVTPQEPLLKYFSPQKFGYFSSLGE